MKLSGELKAFEGRLGHRFAQPALLVRAVTHSSMASPTRDDNQRLEFLGDRVLGLNAIRRRKRGNWPRGSMPLCARKPAPMWRARSTWEPF